MQETFKIGTVARRAGVSVDTVRFYERRGLLPRANRRPSGYRIYGAGTVERVRLIKHIQALGVGLDEIGEMLAMIDRGTATCDNQRPRFARIIARIDEEVAALRAKRRAIVSVLRRCERGACRLEDGRLSAGVQRSPPPSLRNAKDATMTS